jgi:predicted HTH transcriptional regulator
MIEVCRSPRLPDPSSRRVGRNRVTLRKSVPAAVRRADWGLSERRLQALEVAAARRRITNADYQATFGVSKATATRELDALTKLGALRKVGSRGAGVHYLPTGGTTAGSG